MRILLCGDYSSVHSELAKGLKSLGYKVTVLSDGDGYKDFPADIKIVDTKINRSNVYKFFCLIMDFFGVYGFLNYINFRRKINLEFYDVVHIINPVVVPQFGAIGNILFLKYLKSKSGSFFMSALGDDTRWVWACLINRYKYSALDRLTIFNFYKYYFSIKYILNPAYLLLHIYSEKISSGVVASLDDYNIAYSHYKGRLSFIPLPISLDRFQKPKTINEANKKIKIFHAWQKGKESKKGNDVLHSAMLEVTRKYGSKVEYVIASDMPYLDFIKKYKECDIYIDQVYSYDRGVAGALGMCAGKVVFSGFELSKRFSVNAPVNIKDIGVNAVGDIEDLVSCFSYFIENKSEINTVSNNAYTYATESYESVSVARKYIEFWKNDS